MPHLVRDDAESRHVSVGAQRLCGRLHLASHENVVEIDRIVGRAVLRVLGHQITAGRADAIAISGDARTGELLADLLEVRAPHFDERVVDRPDLLVRSVDVLRRHLDPSGRICRARLRAELGTAKSQSERDNTPSYCRYWSHGQLPPRLIPPRFRVVAHHERATSRPPTEKEHGYVRANVNRAGR